MAYVTILEPMSTGDVIDRAVRLYRRNFAPLVTIASMPSLLGFVVSMLFWFGLAELENPGRSGFNPAALLFFMLGALGYPVWLFVLLMTIAGLSRVVGDQIMLEEPITFRKCVSAVRHRFKDVFVMALLSLAAIVAIYMIVSIIIFVLFLIVGVVGGVIAAAGLPPAAIGVLVGLVAIVAIAAVIFSTLVILVRVTFLPQIVMLEGYPAGTALTRAITLGKGNWHRLGAIVLFGYFVSLSLQAALLLPIMALLYLSGLVSSEFFAGQSWNAIYGACSQIASLLVLPIWIISLTLLYFDSRVRKEAYDLELLAREIAPGFYWQPPAAGEGREFVQTSPLGLAGYGARRSPSLPPVAQGAEETSDERDGERDGETGGEPEREEDSSSSGPSSGPSPGSGGLPSITICVKCMTRLDPDSRFCDKCGAPAYGSAQ